MAKVVLKGNPINTVGELPKVGSKAPDFKLTNSDLQDKSLADFKGKKKILNIVHSLDTGTCATSAKKFNEAVTKLNNTVVITISADLPFAQSRFCGAENLKNIVTLSMMRDKNFAKDYGVLVLDGPIAGICARSIVVLDENDKVVYTEQVHEVTGEPNYDKALAAVK